MLTIGEKIILGATALFLGCLCAFAVIHSTQAPLVPTVETEAVPVITEQPAITEAPATQVQPTVSLPQEAIVPEIVPVDLNTATLEQLDDLPSIGETLGQRIIDYRTANGNFETVEDIMKVEGIGELTLEKIRLYVCVEEGLE